MSKQTRQDAILALIRDNEIETQNDLVEMLIKSGYAVTQATVSRDIQELGLVKSTPSGKGKSRYVKPLDPKLQRLKTLFHQSVLSIDYTGNMIVIHTIVGSANTAAMLIDSISDPEIMGTIAGDDTILIIVEHAEATEKTVNTLKEFLD